MKLRVMWSWRAVVLAGALGVLLGGCDDPGADEGSGGGSGGDGTGATEQDGSMGPGFGGGPSHDGGSTGGDGTGGGSGGADAGTGGGSTDGGTLPTGDASSTPGVGGKEFPAAELGVKIIGPSSADSVAIQNAVVSINGLVFGNASSISVVCSCGQTVEGAGSPFWGSPPLNLTVGDNEITVTAHGADGSTVTDHVRITYNPQFDFDGPPVARPPSIWVGEKTELFFTIPISLYPNFDPSTAELIQVDASGNQVAVWKMHDNGAFATSGDEVPGDGVFSVRLSVTHPTPETLWFRVRVKVIPADGGAGFNAWSDVITVDALQHFTGQECQAVLGAAQAAQAAFDGAWAQGAAVAQDAALASLQANPSVVSSGKSPIGNGVWAAFGSGVLAAVDGSAPGTRGGGAPGYTTVPSAALGGVPIQSRSVAVLSPFAQELQGVDETPEIASSLRSKSCPKFAVDERTDVHADLAAFRTLHQKGIAAIATHGDALFGGLSADAKARYRWDHSGNQEVLWTGEPVECAKLMQAVQACDNANNKCGGNAECIFTNAQGTSASGYCLDNTQVDAKMGRVAINGRGKWGVLPSFFSHHANNKPFPDSLVYLGACSSLWNGTLARELYGAGAKAIAGFSGVVTSTFAKERGLDFFNNMLELELPAGAAAVSKQDPDHEGSFFRLFGASNLSINESDIINADFEKGNSIGWDIQGDGRVISQFGAALPVLGKFMGIISTGMGYTVQTGELRQTFCIPSGKTQLSFYWKFYSEEFLEWCGSEYQDTFQASIQGEQGTLSTVDVRVDDLCPANQCAGCGAKAVPLTPSDLSFDQGDVHSTQWQQATANVSTFAGAGPITLKFFTTDAGDSIYDTAILVDSLKFE